MAPPLRLWASIELGPTIGRCTCAGAVSCTAFDWRGQSEEFFQSGEHPQQHSGPSDKALSGDKMTKYTTNMGFMWTAVRRNALMDDMVAAALLANRFFFLRKKS